MIFIHIISIYQFTPYKITKCFKTHYMISYINHQHFVPLIIISDFNVDMLQPPNAVHQPHNSKYFQIFMNQRILQIQIDISITKYNLANSY